MVCILVSADVSPISNEMTSSVFISGVDRHRFECRFSDPIFHFDADPDPDLSPSSIHVRKSEIFYLFLFIIFVSLAFHQRYTVCIIIFSSLGQHRKLFWKKGTVDPDLATKIKIYRELSTFSQLRIL